MTEPRLVVVTMVMSTFAAEAVRGALAAAGVPAVTRGEQHASWLFAGSGGGLGLVQVLVDEDRLDEARAVLAELEAAEADAEPDLETDEDAEPEDEGDDDAEPEDDDPAASPGGGDPEPDDD